MTRLGVRIVFALALLLVPVQLFAFGQNKIVYDQFKWNVYQSTHFEVYFYDDERESLQKVVNIAESAYDELSRKLNYQIPKRIPLLFYATHSAFEQTNVILNFIPEGVGAFAEPVRNRMVLPIDMPDHKLYALIKHELTHIFQYEILFRGRYDRAVRARPPTWLMEGMASYMAADEDTGDRMVLRDAVVNDLIPSVSNPFGGFFAYRFGHAVFRFMESQWGEEGVRDFIYEYRNNLGPSVEKSLKRAFNLTIEEFDAKFRTWLRRRYLPALIEKGEPQEFGEPFHADENVMSTETSPAISPSGDIVAALTTYKQDVDVALFNVRKRNMIRNLSAGLPEKYEYVIGQMLTTGPVAGRDVAFSPDGDHVAFFVKKERGRNLMIVNSVSGAIERSIPMKKAEQQLNPAYSPDGKKVAFSAIEGNKADIYLLDLESGSVTNVTNDPYFDVAPVFSPDGKWLIYSSVSEGNAKIFQLDLASPDKRYRLTTGEWNDIDAAYSPDGKRIFFVSDRPTARNAVPAEKAQPGEAAAAGAQPEGEPRKSEQVRLDEFSAFNVYSLSLETGEIVQYTDVVGGCATPQVFIGEDNEERVLFTSYYKTRNRLYVAKTSKTLGVVEKVALPTETVSAAERIPFIPPVDVALDPEKERKETGFHLFLDDVQVNVGFADDQTFVSRSVLIMSDMLGNRRIIAALDSVQAFANFDFIYFDQSKRTTWGTRVYDTNEYYTAYNPQTSQTERVQEAYHETGFIGFLAYPFDRFRRIEAGGGYIMRKISYPSFGSPEGDSYSQSDNFPIIFTALSGDNTHFREFGPVSGRRYNVIAQYAPDLKEGGTLTSDLIVDFRNYRQLTQRSLLASRFYGAMSNGSFPNIFYFGGLNTLRGYDYRSIVGDRAFYANFELRIPLIDRFDTAINLNFGQIRANFFVDIGGAWFNGQDFTLWEDGKLKDGLASVGWGLSVNFMGAELHWDFAKRTNLSTIEDDTRTTFWIGTTF